MEECCKVTAFTYESHYFGRILKMNAGRGGFSSGRHQKLLTNIGTALQPKETSIEHTISIRVNIYSKKNIMADRRFRNSTTTSICCKCLESDFLVIKSQSGTALLTEWRRVHTLIACPLRRHRGANPL